MVVLYGVLTSPLSCVARAVYKYVDSEYQHLKPALLRRLPEAQELFVRIKVHDRYTTVAERLHDGTMTSEGLMHREGGCWLSRVCASRESDSPPRQPTCRAIDRTPACFFLPWAGESASVADRRRAAGHGPDGHHPGRDRRVQATLRTGRSSDGVTNEGWSVDGRRTMNRETAGIIPVTPPSSLTAVRRRPERDDRHERAACHLRVARHQPELLATARCYDRCRLGREVRGEGDYGRGCGG
jgi:hypothetical protein